MKVKDLSKLWKKNNVFDGLGPLVIVHECKHWTYKGQHIDNPFQVGRATSHIIDPNRVIVQQNGIVALMYYKNFALHGELLKENII
jgi:hypothetical protein